MHRRLWRETCISLKLFIVDNNCANGRRIQFDRHTHHTTTVTGSGKTQHQVTIDIEIPSVDLDHKWCFAVVVRSRNRRTESRRNGTVRRRNVDRTNVGARVQQPSHRFAGIRTGHRGHTKNCLARVVALIELRVMLQQEFQVVDSTRPRRPVRRTIAIIVGLIHVDADIDQNRH
jgi:hypothetical protein